MSGPGRRPGLGGVLAGSAEAAGIVPALLEMGGKAARALSGIDDLLVARQAAAWTELKPPRRLIFFVHNVLWSKHPVHCPLPPERRKWLIDALYEGARKDANERLGPGVFNTVDCLVGASSKASRKDAPTATDVRKLRVLDILTPPDDYEGGVTRRKIPVIDLQKQLDQLDYHPDVAEEPVRGTRRQPLVCSWLNTSFRSVVNKVRQAIGHLRAFSDGEIYNAMHRAALLAINSARAPYPLDYDPGWRGPGTRLAAHLGSDIMGSRRIDRPGTVRACDTYVQPAERLAMARSLSADDIAAELVRREVRLAYRSKLQSVFPRKPHPQAGKKCNVFLDCVLSDAAREAPIWASHVVKVLAAVPPGTLYEDQVCGVLLHTFPRRNTSDGLKLLAFLIYGLTQPAALKGLSDVLKATGTNTLFDYADLVELHCLLGRGVAEEDLEADALRRTTLEGSGAVKVDLNQLGEAIEIILAEELGDRRPRIISSHEHWTRRYAWCVAGGHSYVTNRDPGFSKVPRTGPQGKRMTRRMACEYVEDDPLPNWEGDVAVSVIPKLEQGKVRTIYSCNTISYCAFSRLLEPVERVWAGRRVIIDPGAGGNYGMYRRIRTAWPRTAPVAVMLDYADFNSQHTLEAQQEVIRRLAARCDGIEEATVDTLVRSFKKMELYLEGKHLGRVAATLMSGHRGTSFINSVLNAAYLICALGPEWYRKTTSFHVGDDVLIFTTTVDAAYEIIEKTAARGFTLQRVKQSVGIGSFEFLRMAGSRTLGAHGYLARCVSSTVSGNWASDWRDDRLGALHSMVQMARSVINRSGDLQAWKLMVSSCSAATGIPREALGDILSGNVALGNGPCYRTDGRYSYRPVLNIDRPRRSRASMYFGLPQHATSQYFTEGCDRLEKLAMSLTGVRPRLAALRSTYGDLADGPDGAGTAGEVGHTSVTISLGAVEMRLKRGQVDLDDQLDAPVRHGRLVCYPIIALLQHELTDAQIEELLRAAGIPFEAGEARIVAFGGVREGTTVRGWLPYSDAAGLGTRQIAAAVNVRWPLRL